MAIFGLREHDIRPRRTRSRRQALLLYSQGYRITRVAEMLGEKPATLHSWIKRDKGATMARWIRCS
ncbi:MAG: terminase gpP N-terminus-related DNA-binding protein [Pantoea agglomerans]